MSYGITIWDQNGVIVLSTEDRMGTIVGEYVHTFNDGDDNVISFYDENFAKGEPLYFLTELPDAYFKPGDPMYSTFGAQRGEGGADISFSGNTCTIEISRLVYGGTARYYGTGVEGTLRLFYGYF